MKKIIALAFPLFVSLSLFAQVDYSKQYQNAKDFFRQGKYNLAMESFKPLITYDEKNQYGPYASFYYGLSAYKQGYDAVARDMFLQIKKVYPKWDKTDDVNLWLGIIYLRNHDYFQGLKMITAIQDKKQTDYLKNIKEQYLAEITDPETLKMMLEEYPTDPVIARLLARALSKDLSDEQNKQDLDQLIQRFKLQRSDFVPEAPKTFHKDRYSVAVLLPFMLETLDAKPDKKRNQIVLDFYEGIKLALDSLNTQGPQISLRAYDTDKGIANLKRVLDTEELRNTDLIIGPLYPEENKLVQAFSMKQQVNVVNPFSNNTDIIGDNPYAFLFQPSSEVIGRKTAEYIASHHKRKPCMVFFGTNHRDSVLAENFVREAGELGLPIVYNQAINREDAGDILSILTTATEYDEFKYPSQFTLKKDSIGSIFVATDEPLIYTKIISGVETRADSIVVLGSENWIDDTAVPFEKFQTLRVVFSAANFVSVNNPRRQSFISRYLKKYGHVPSNLSQLGYELMMLFGNQLKTNGVYFQDGLQSADAVPGYLSQGFNFHYTRDNQVIPFVKFVDGKLSLIEVR
jgi:ABC-type branched-subunit amino acid transport system substrate-binding protein